MPSVAGSPQKSTAQSPCPAPCRTEQPARQPADQDPLKRRTSPAVALCPIPRDAIVARHQLRRRLDRFQAWRRAGHVRGQPLSCSSPLARHVDSALAFIQAATEQLLSRARDPRDRHPAGADRRLDLDGHLTGVQRTARPARPGQGTCRRSRRSMGNLLGTHPLRLRSRSWPPERLRDYRAAAHGDPHSPGDTRNLGQSPFSPDPSARLLARPARCGRSARQPASRRGRRRCTRALPHLGDFAEDLRRLGANPRRHGCGSSSPSRLALHLSACAGTRSRRQSAAAGSRWFMVGRGGRSDHVRGLP